MPYDINFQILNYELYHQFIQSILENKNNKYPIQSCNPIGYSSCGFPIEHYVIGSGTKEIVYMGGAHGNEIIGVDFLLQFMKNLALGNGAFQDFPSELFQIHFFPLQNPEGFFTTTYAIHEAMKDHDEKKFCQDYYQKYRHANQMISSLHKILQECSSSISFDILKRNFWNYVGNHELSVDVLKKFLKDFASFKDIEQIDKLWNRYFLPENILFPFDYQKPFSHVTLDCIPNLTPSHSMLRNKLQTMYINYPFPNYTLSNFCANALGVNLNENNEPYFHEFHQLLAKEGNILVAPIYGSYSKSVPSPFGLPSETDTHFTYAIENQAVLDFLEQRKASLYAFINCHSTGGMLYMNPVSNSKENLECDFSFYINNRIATEYLKEIQKSYQKYGVTDFYLGMGYPKKISGFGDVLRRKYPANFLLELSKAGGNPLGPYVFPNYELTMKVNMDASQSLFPTILELEHLYEKTYRKSYNNLGRVHYEEGRRIRKL